MKQAPLRLAVAALCWLPPLALAAQTASPGDTVAGRAVSALDGHPIAHARVSLTEVESGKQVANVLTSGDGAFRFDPVPPGKYRLAGGADGYILSAYLHHDQLGTAIVTGKGLTTDALILELTPNAEIAGRVVDQTGEPVQNARITLFREAANEGQERVRQFRSAVTEDDGSYDLTNLPPGRYFVSVHATPWYAISPQVDPPGASFRYQAAIDPALVVAYPTVFYPNAQSSDDASPIELHGADVVTANVQLTPQPAVMLSLRRGEEQSRSFPQLVEKEFGVEEVVSTPGMFMNGVQELTGIAPGHYELRQYTNGSPFPGQMQEVDLSAGSVSLDAPAPQPQASVTAAVHLANGSKLPAHTTVNLRSAGAGSPQVASNAVNEKGVATFANVPPGDYRLNAFSDGRPATVAQLVVNGHPVAGHVLHVTGSDPVAAGVTLGDRPARLEGFAKREGRPAVATMVVLVPAGADTGPELFRRDQSDLDGSFALPNVAPGNYVLIAVDDGWQLRWTDAATMLRYLPHGVPITVPESGPAVVHLPDAVPAQPH